MVTSDKSGFEFWFTERSMIRMNSNMNIYHDLIDKKHQNVLRFSKSTDQYTLKNKLNVLSEMIICLCFYLLSFTVEPRVEH